MNITIDRAVVEQALEALEAFLSDELRPYEAAKISAALRAALAQQAEPTWVCPDSPEHRYAKPGHCEDCGKTLVQEQGCDHCNHPLYAATRCRVCGRVTEQAEPVEPVAWVRLEAWKSGKDWPDDCFTALPAEGLTPVYTAPPQRKPLTEEAVQLRIYALQNNWSSDDSWQNVMALVRAIERAHGIPMPEGDPK